MKKLIAIGSLILASTAVLADEDVLAKLDTDNDGRISIEEAASDAPLSAVFAELDANNDGYLTPSELEG
ncbi:MAG: Ca2+-binding EF-hand superfamily protein [Paraglaciecola sp.]|jgi:Ca2+-binding EF-hand superfamily protein